MAASDTPPSASPRRLRRGRHGLPREQVVASQHERMVAAMLHVVATKGYSEATVADVVARAAVSKTTFYEQFGDREACFLASYAYARTHVEAELADAVAELPAETPWRGRLKLEIDTYLEVLAAEPELALTLHQEVLSVGAGALDHRATLLALLAGRIVAVDEIAHAQEPSLAPTPPELLALYAGGLDELIRDHLRVAGPESLPTLGAPLLRATLALLGR